MEDSDRVILLNHPDDSVDSIDSLTDSTGMFSMTELAEENEESPQPNNKNADEKNEEEHDPSSMIYVAAVIAALGGLLFGYDIGIISGAKTQIQKELLLSCTQIESIVAMLPVGAMIASFLGGGLVDKHGRRNMIIVNAGIFTIGALLISGTSTFILLLLGRFILGFAVSLSAIAECIYISELSTPAKRGMLVSFNELAITVGILVAFLVNYCLVGVPGGWRIMFNLSIGIALFQGLAMLFLPKTPQYLMIQKKDAQAEAIIKKLKLSTNVRQTMTDIRLALTEESSSKLCQSENNMNGRMLIGIGLVMAQQLTGQPNIIYYAADVFKTVGFCSEFSSTLASVGLGIMKVVSTAISLSIVDKVGRKKALISGIAVMGFAVLVLGIFASVDNSEVSGKPCTEYTNHLMKHNLTNNNNTNVTEKDLNQIVVIANSEEINTCPEATTSKSLRIIAFLALVTYVCAYSFGFGPITWILLSEIFPPSVKGRAMATVTSINWALNFGVSATFVEISAAFTVGGLYICYAILCLLSVIFVIFVIPETRQKSLEDISKTLKDTKICGFCSHSSTNKKSHTSYSILGSSTTTLA